MELTAFRQKGRQRAYPDDWRETSIGEYEPFVTSGSRGWAAYYSNHGDLFVRITNMDRQSIALDLDDSRFVSLPPSETEGVRTQLREGDVIISITADIGIISFIGSDVPSPAYINQHISLVRFKPEIICSKFVAYFLAHWPTQRWFRSITDQGAKAGINLDAVRNIKLVVPPTTEEQRDIATALSDVDALLDGLDRLIAKKRDIKQAAMQQLLTGKTRLPGFEGEWEVKRLGDICSMKSGEGITSANIDQHSKFPCYGGNGLRGYTETYTHEGDYSLIGRQGALCGNVVRVSGKFFASEHALVVTPSPDTDVDWLSIMLDRMSLNQYSESSAQPGLSAAKLLVLDMIWPLAKEEQAAIATLLSDMDTEIEALEKRRAKTADLKQAMMQELLTGRTRLV